MKKINKILSLFGLALMKKDTTIKIKESIKEWASWFDEETYEPNELFAPSDGRQMKKLLKLINETID